MILTSPATLTDYSKHGKIFLAGSINNGKTLDWQSDLANYLNDIGYLVFNPRRTDWREQQDPKIITQYLKEQIQWELKHLELANIIIYNFADEQLAPITLLELGLHLYNKSKEVYVVCTEEYPRYANVKTTCDFYGIKVYDSIDKVKLIL
jgi:hypothetical protein